MHSCVDTFLLDHVVFGHIFASTRGGFGARLDFPAAWFVLYSAIFRLTSVFW